MKRYTILLTMLSLILFSCGGKDKSADTVITWWQFWTDATIKPVIKEIISDFEGKHPGVKVELVDLTWSDGHDKIAIAFSSHAGPDVVELGSDWVLEFITSGHLLDITGKIGSDKNSFLMWDPATYENRLYGFPWILGTRVLYANTELLARAGYQTDFSPQNWNDLLQSAKKINDLNSDIFGFGSNSAEKHRLYKKFLPFLWSNGGRILSDDGRKCLLNQPEALEALKYYQRLCSSTGLTDTQRRLEDVFLEGRLGYVISGDWLLKRIAREKPDIRFSTCLIPGPKSLNESRSFAGGEYLVINSESKNPDMAYQLIRHITSPENQLKFCLANKTANPSSVETAKDSSFLLQPHFDTFIRQMKTAQMPPMHPRWVYIEDRFEKAIEAALYGSKTPEQAFDDATVEIEELLKP